MKMVVRLRRFKKEDWYAWAGCEKFSDGSEPLITYDLPKPEGWPKEKEKTVQLVADKGGIGIYSLERSYNLGLENEHLVQLLAETLVQKNLSVPELMKLGFVLQ